MPSEGVEYTHNFLQSPTLSPPGEGRRAKTEAGCALSFTVAKQGLREQGSTSQRDAWRRVETRGGTVLMKPFLPGTTVSVLYPGLALCACEARRRWENPLLNCYFSFQVS